MYVGFNLVKMAINISVIVPCFNQGIYLRECVNSILIQSFQNWECIIIDDGSTDDTSEIAFELLQKDSRLKYFKKINGGLSSARNFGIEKASGEFILPLDADDYISSNYLELTRMQFATSSTVKVAYGMVEYFGVFQRREISHPEFNFEKQLYYNQIHCCGLFRREEAIGINGYDEKMVYGYEDWDFYIRLIGGIGLAVQVTDCNLFYRIKDVSMSTLLRSDGKELIAMNYLFAKNIDFYTKYDISAINLLRSSKEQSHNPASYYSYKFLYGVFVKKLWRTLKVFVQKTAIICFFIFIELFLIS